MEVKLDEPLQNIGLLLGALKKYGTSESTTVNEDWFKDCLQEFSAIPKRVGIIYGLLDQLLSQTEHVADTLIPSGERWFNLAGKGTPGNGLCLIATCDSPTDPKRLDLDLGIFDRFAQGRLTYTTYGRLPLLRLSADFGLQIRMATPDIIALTCEISQTAPASPTPDDRAFELLVVSAGARFEAGFRPKFSIKAFKTFDKSKKTGDEIEIHPEKIKEIFGNLIKNGDAWLDRCVGDPEMFTVGEAFEWLGFIEKADDSVKTEKYKLKSLPTNLDAFVQQLKGQVSVWATKMASAAEDYFNKITSDGIYPAFLPNNEYGFRIILRKYELPFGVGPLKVALGVGANICADVPDDAAIGFVVAIGTVIEGKVTIAPRVISAQLGIELAGIDKPLFENGAFKLQCLQADVAVVAGEVTGAIRLDKFTLPFGGSAKSSGPAGKILNAVAPAVDAGADDKKTAKPSLSLLARYQKHDRHPQSQPEFSAQLYDGESKPTDIVWLPSIPDIGPLHIDTLGIGVSRAQGTNAGLMLKVSGNVAMAAFRMGLTDAGLLIPFNDPLSLKATLGGLDASLKLGDLAVSGGLLRISDDEYSGELSVTVPKCSIGALGVYGTREGKTTFFIFGALSVTGGAGLQLGAIKIVGAALGLGVNRQLKIPEMRGIPDYPLVQMAMGGLKPEGKGAIAALQDITPFADGQFFGCVGLKMIIGEVVEAVALAIARFGNELDFTMLGLAKLEKTIPGGKKDDLICSVELALKVVLKPREGSFLAQAELTGNSWVLSKDCRLTGGFALALWFGGKHKGDYVITLGGYHPRFKRPEHYPDVPRVGLNWTVTKELTIKGEMYFAITPSMLMAGARLEATYDSSSIFASFVAYVDFLMEWAPLHYEADAGVSIRVKKETFIRNIDVTVAANVKLWGPPFGGKADVDVLGIFSFNINFGEQPKKPDAIKDWAAFGSGLLDKRDGLAWAVNAGEPFTSNAPALIQAALVKGAAAEAKRSDRPIVEASAQDAAQPWIVRSGEMELAISTAVPVNEILLEKLGKRPDWHTPSLSAQHLVVANGVAALPNTSVVKFSRTTALGVRPMKLAAMRSVLRVAILDSSDMSLDIQDWSLSEDVSGVPAALWDTDLKPANSPDSKVISECLVGLKSMRPPAGKMLGEALHDSADHLRQKLPPRAASAAGETEDTEHIVALLGRSWHDELSALATLGFLLPANTTVGEGASQ